MYDFIIATSKKLTVLEGKKYNASGVLVSDVAYKATEQTQISRYEDLSYLGALSCTLTFFNASGAFISNLAVNFNNSQIKKPVGASSYALSMNASAEFSGSMLNSMVVVPHFKELTKKLSRESNQKFFRESLEGKITVHANNGYEYVKSSGLDDELVLVVYKNVPSRTIYSVNVFTKVDCKFNTDKKSCELKLSTNDGYKDILDNIGNTYDLIKLAPPLTKLEMSKRSMIQVYIRGSSVMSNFIAGTYFETDVVEVSDSHDDLINKFKFSYIKAFTEFKLEGFKDPNLNGTYSGENGVFTNGRFVTNMVYTSVGGGKNTYTLNFMQKGSSAVLYRSVTPYNVLDVNNKYITNPLEIVNVLDNSDRHMSLNHIVFHIYQRILSDVNAISGVNTYPIDVNDIYGNTQNYKRVVGYTGSHFFCSRDVVQEPTRYGINDFGEYFTNEFLPQVVGVDRTMPVCRSTWGNSSIWFAHDSSYFVFDQSSRKQYVSKDCMLLADVINTVIKKINPKFEHKPTEEFSRFLYGSTNPMGFAKFDLVITQKTNILKSEYDQAAQEAEITLEDITKMLRDAFRCYWYIEDNKFKIEHVHWFMRGGSYSGTNTVQIDLTSTPDAFNKKAISFFQNNLEFDKTELSSRYEFSFMDECTDTFRGSSIDVKAKYVQSDKTEEININAFSTDLDLMLLNPEAFSDDGFVLLATSVENGVRKTIFSDLSLADEKGKRYTVSAQNGLLSWFNLINYYMYDMPATQIEYSDIGATLVNVRDIKRCMTQSVQFKSLSDVEAFKLITTDMGDGSLVNASINLITRNIEATLEFVPK